MPSRIAKKISAVPRSRPTTTSAGGEQQARHHRHHHLVQVAEPAVLVGVDVRCPQDQGELGELGGLDHDRSEGQPVRVAADGDAEEGREQQQPQRDEVPRPGQSADPLRGESTRDPGTRHRQGHPHQLALDHGVGVAVVDPEGVHARGAEHHDQADGQQQGGRTEQQVVRRQRAIESLTQRGEMAMAGTAGRGEVVTVVDLTRRHGGDRRTPSVGRRYLDVNRSSHPRAAGRPRRRRRPVRHSWRTCPSRRIPGPAARCRPTGPTRRLRPRRAPWRQIHQVPHQSRPPRSRSQAHRGRVAKGPGRSGRGRGRAAPLPATDRGPRPRGRRSGHPWPARQRPTRRSRRPATRTAPRAGWWPWSRRPR